MNALILTVTDFDESENSTSHAEYTQYTKIFADTPNGETAYAKLQEFLKTQVFRPYAGWNDEIYPQFKIKKTTIE